MTKQEKQLLLVDLCARLPYGVKVKIKNIIQPQRLHWSYISDEKDWDLPKPYLRPMSSMTEEEQEEFVQFHCVNNCPIVIKNMLTLDNESRMFDWLNAHHFDFRNLIEKGLALGAPEGMYKF